MFRILDSQMEALGQDTRRAFVATMVGYLREHFSAWASQHTRDDLVAWVDRAVGKAAAHGVATEPEAAQLILLWTVLGLDAEERLAWVRETLEDGDLTAIGKVRRLVSLCRRHEVPALERVLVYDDLED